MAELVLTTFDWVPEIPRGYVRDVRVRWALEGAGLPYRVEGVPFRDRNPGHFAHQPFGQVPWQRSIPSRWRACPGPYGLADYPACRAYITRATARPAFVKAHADQMAHFAAAD